MKTETQTHCYQVMYFAAGEYAVYRVQSGNIAPVTGYTRDVKTLNKVCRSMAKKDNVQAFTRDNLK